MLCGRKQDRKFNTVAPGKTMLSAMSPTFVFNDKNELILNLGSPGGVHIIGAVVQVILNVLEFDMPLGKAISVPRIHQQWYPEAMKMEEEMADSVRVPLAQWGHSFDPTLRRIANVQGLAFEGGRWVSVSDARYSILPR